MSACASHPTRLPSPSPHSVEASSSSHSNTASNTAPNPPAPTSSSLTNSADHSPFSQQGDSSSYHHDSGWDFCFAHSTQESDSHDGAMSDDYDVEDGGAPVNFGDITNILTQGVDLEYHSDPQEDMGLLSLPPFYQANLDLEHSIVLGMPLPAAQIGNTNNTTTQPPNQALGPPEDAAAPAHDAAQQAGQQAQFPHHPQLLHLNLPANPTTTTTALEPANYNLADFIRAWAWRNGVWQPTSRDHGRFPWLDRIRPQFSKNISQVLYSDLTGDCCDVQAIDWDDLGVTRYEARQRRLLMYKNFVNFPRSDRWQKHQDVLPATDNFFRFQRLDVRKNVNLEHFQLRNVLASTSRSQVFYPGQTAAVHQFNPVSGKGKIAMKPQETPHLKVSTLAADYGMLIAGGFFGEYCFRRLNSCEPVGRTPVYEGSITDDNSGITNHVQLHLSRTSSRPKAAFASNDRGFRVLDLETDKFVSEIVFPHPINCSALSPDRRLRVMVGDQQQVLITKAEADGQPEILQCLRGHEDFGFACDWADDGWTVATGFQDKSVKIWDARRWTDIRGVASPVCTIRSEMAGVRTLKFSPIGSGKRLLVAAEEADFVNIIDAQTFESKQTFDFFGEIGGVSFVNEGQNLYILCCDSTRGGLFQLERCGVGAERRHDPDDMGYGPIDMWHDKAPYDWSNFGTTPGRLTQPSEARRRRRALALDPLIPF